MASLRKRNEFWYIRYRDETGKQTERKASRDKSVAKSMAKSLEDKVSGIKLGTLDPRAADARDAERLPITEHVNAYVRNLEAKGRCPEHVQGVRKRLAWFLEETMIKRLSQLKPEVADLALATLRAAGRSDQTVKHYATTLKSFSQWLKKNRRTTTDLLDDLDRPEIITAAERVALPPELTARLIETTRQRPRRRGMSGEDRSWLYALAAITGLRRGELQSLTPESFSLDGNPPVVSLPGRATKNRKDAVQPLPSHVVPALRSWLASKPVERSLWPPSENTALMIRADLKAAGIAPEPYCFHSLRHTYITAIDRCGGSVKDSMELARHHDPELTFNRYAHTRLADLSKVVDRIPDLLSHALPTSSVSTGLNGSTLQITEPCPERSKVDPLGHDDQSHRSGRAPPALSCLGTGRTPASGRVVPWSSRGRRSPCGWCG